MIGGCEELEIEEGFGSIGMDNGQDEAVDAQGGLIVQSIGLERAHVAAERDAADEADNKERAKGQGERQAKQAQDSGDDG